MEKEFIAIGERVEFEGVKVRARETFQPGCSDCLFKTKIHGSYMHIRRGCHKFSCTKYTRSDKKNVVFVEG